MKVLYIAISFLMTLGICLGIYTTTYDQFNLNGATLSYSTTNQVIAQGGAQYNGTNAASNTNNSGGNSTSGSVANVCVSIIPGACSLITWWENGWAYVECQLGNTVTCNPNAGTISTDLAVTLGSQNVFGIPTLITSSALSSTNQWFQLFNNPLDSALTIMGIFLGLGILAGLLGAGILARVMASVGIGLSVITYIEGSLAVFNGLPGLIFIGFNGIIGILLLIIAWESFNAPGGN